MRQYPIKGQFYQVSSHRLIVIIKRASQFRILIIVTMIVSSEFHIFLADFDHLVPCFVHRQSTPSTGEVQADWQRLDSLNGLSCRWRSALREIMITLSMKQHGTVNILPLMVLHLHLDTLHANCAFPNQVTAFPTRWTPTDLRLESLFFLSPVQVAIKFGCSLVPWFLKTGNPRNALHSIIYVKVTVTVKSNTVVSIWKDGLRSSECPILLIMQLPSL